MTADAVSDESTGRSVVDRGTIAGKANLLLDAMAQFDPADSVVLADDADHLATTMPALVANAM